jgi:uncharacterized membrane protein
MHSYFAERNASLELFISYSVANIYIMNHLDFSYTIFLQLQLQRYPIVSKVTDKGVYFNFTLRTANIMLYAEYNRLQKLLLTIYSITVYSSNEFILTKMPTLNKITIQCNVMSTEHSRNNSKKTTVNYTTELI